DRLADLDLGLGLLAARGDQREAGERGDPERGRDERCRLRHESSRFERSAEPDTTAFHDEIARSRRDYRWLHDHGLFTARSGWTGEVLERTRNGNSPVFR